MGYRVCEIELSHKGTNNRNPDLVCKKDIIYMCIFIYISELIYNEVMEYETREKAKVAMQNHTGKKSEF